MMCSEKELGVGEDHNGIIELPANTPIGRPAAEALDIDPVIEINITPNRAECLGRPRRGSRFGGCRAGNP